MADFKRPEAGFRFDFGGTNTKEVPDALGPDKYQATLNVRATAEHSLRTRPGYFEYFIANNNNNNFNSAAITDMRAYTGLNSNSYPRVLARDALGRVFLDTNKQVGAMNGNAGYAAVLNSWRPKESATPWMYISQAGDYQRFSSPDANNNVIQNKVGIAEPQMQVLAQSEPPNWQWLGPANTALWPTGGNNTTATANITRSNASVAVTPSVDPVEPTRQSLIVSGNNAYGIGQVLGFNNNAFMAIIEDVIPPVANINPLPYSTIRYKAGNNGDCTIFVGQIPTASVVGGVVQGLRRGAVMQFNTANSTGEFCLVRDVVFGANGIVAIDTSTVNNWNIANASVAFWPTVVINSNNNAGNGMSMVSTGMSANLNAGISVISHNLTGSSAFSIVNGQVPQEDDYIHMSILLSDPTQLVQLLLLFYLDSPSNFATIGNCLYYAVRQGDLAQVVSGQQQLVPATLGAAEAQLIGALPTPEDITPPAQSASGNNMWTELLIPVSSLQPIGSDRTKSLASCAGFQMQINVSGPVTFSWSSFWNAAGSGPDVGNNGAGYKYLAVPSNSNTGIDGNPTPLMRYAVNPRRQAVLLNTANLNSSYDPQIDTWRIYRYGGSVTVTEATNPAAGYRFIGTTPIGGNFTDTFDDDAAGAGDEVVIDNTEPWPTIDQPWTFSGTANAYGQFLVIASGSPLPATMTRWLPGTLFQIGTSQDTFTLRNRPTVSGNNATFEFEECIGSGSQSNRVIVLEPNVANQPLPYVWGPDEYGTMFACGDTFRPGTVSFSKTNSPDAAPTANDVEICPPSEPLLGGRIIKGLSLVASSRRWWYLNFQSGNAEEPYIPVGAPIGKRLASPYGMDSDYSTVYFWAEDCIAATTGGDALSLTDEDLYNLFPHGDTAGTNVVRAGVTFYAPDYSRAAQFRLTLRNGILHAIYLDSTGAYRIIVYDIARKAWSQDVFADTITSMYNIEQPGSTFVGAQVLYPSLLMGDNNGIVWQSRDLTNDHVTGGNAGVGISGTVATREFNAGDARADTEFGDLYLDLTAPAGANATPIVSGQPIIDANNNAISTVISANNNRQFIPISLEGQQLENFMGLKVTWTDNFNTQTKPTFLHLWQPSYVDKPETTTTRFGDTVNFGEASYMRGVTIYADTYAANKVVMIRNMDNNTLVPLQSVASANNTASIINHAGEQEINYWFNPPFVAHMVRFEPQDAVPWRSFKLEWLKDKWPELTDLPSPWMNIRDTGQAGFLQGLVLPLETGDPANNTAPQLRLRTDIGNNTFIDLVPIRNTEFNVKTGIPYSLAAPVICHQVQIVPQQKCRVWWSEIEWKAEATPELAANWITQWTSFGRPGFKTIPKIEGTYNSVSGFTLTISIQDGTAPQQIVFPATVGTQKFFFNLTFNKFLLAQFSAVGSAPFQLFMEDFIVYVEDWGRLGAAVPYKLGAEFGDKATI